MCVSDLLRPRESRRSPGAVISPPTLEGGAPADTLFYPPLPQRELAEPTLDFCCEIWRKECEILH